MNIEEARKITRILGKHFEYSYGNLLMLFFTKIPESLLPYPKPLLKDALNMMERYYSNRGDEYGTKLMQEAIAFLEYYCDDEDAIKEAGERFLDSYTRRKLITGLINHQKSWIKTQSNK